MSFFRRARRRPDPPPMDEPRVRTPAEIALAYHERTKHHPHRSAASLGYLDWDSQPDPFRRFDGAPRRLLPLASRDATPPFDALERRARATPAPLGVESLAAFLELSLALSASKSIGDASWFLRVNPSSGNLHPTEGYLLLGPLGAGDPGGALERRGAVLHYAPEDHALEQRAAFDAGHWARLAAGLPAGAFLVGLTTIPWRESWKYGERAYRYCQHDAGHALAALDYAAAVHGWVVRLVGGPADEDVARLLGLDRDDDFADAEREQPLALVAVAPAAAAAALPAVLPGDALAAHSELAWSGRANRLSPEHVEWEVIDVAAEACRKPATEEAPFDGSGGAAVGATAGDRPASARALIVSRRSAVDLDGRTRLPLEAVSRILARTLPDGGPAPRPPFGPIPWEPRVHLAIFVHRVDGLEPGLYALPRSPAAREALAASLDGDFEWTRPSGVPGELPLYRLRVADLRGTAASVSCTQSIAGDGVLSLGMLAELGPTLEERGAWWYRRLHWEAGAIGQVLYLAAEAAGIRGTGIGCFFDDAVHGVLGMRDRRFQTIYHFTMGGPVDDPRLETRSPYPDARRGST